jgi:hypothetical protein
MEPPPIESLKKMDEVCEMTRELSIKIAPLLRELKNELRRERVNQKPSYILLLAAAGFLAEELVDRRIAAPLISDVACAVAHDLIPGQRF